MRDLPRSGDGRVASSKDPWQSLESVCIARQRFQQGEIKFDVRWVDGVWRGITLESGESIIGAPEGVVKARVFRGKPENGGRWWSNGVDAFKGVP